MSKLTAAGFLSVAVLVLVSVSAAIGGEVLKAYAGTEEPVAREIFEEFEKETGIKVEWVRLSGGEAVARIEREKDNPGAAIWVGGVGTMHIELKNKGLTIPYPSPALRNIPKRYRDPENYWVGLYLGPLSICYNTKLMASLNLPIPKGWEDLIKPVYRGHIRIAHPASSGTAYNMVTTIIRLNNGNEDRAFEYLKRFAENVDIFTKSGSEPGKNCAAGQIPIAIGYRHDQVLLKSLKADIEVVMPVEGSGYETASMSLIKNGPNMAAAKRLYDWILSSVFVADLFANWQMLPLSESQSPLGLFRSFNLINQNDSWDAANKTRLLQRWTKDIDEAAPTARKAR